ncbi:ATP-binding cassette domain-containing protein [Microbacterium sp. SYP-A9085]|uniref:ABC transporter ATP-binding protein n=1 Tax=Microbacterium sp. SYP-A9085 TaxID=2664454 RepID=UPI00129BE847|nr:ABC transporter ATP-binding protein [Microbacterium sp. SYP-A9085]MRH29030.1 ATP-binding cassette domain-containing protein [Microbacterium sp. SYP-A9085]
MSTHMETVASPRREDVAAALELRDLHVQLGGASVVNGVSLTVEPGAMLALVGESGAGKSMTAKAAMGLLPPGGHVSGGSILIGGRDVTDLDEGQWRRIRGSEIGMVFQNPLRSLNPTMKVGTQIAEAIRIHRRDLSGVQVKARAMELLDQVQIPNAARRFDEYPHQLSGGMRQRIVIAIALSCAPRVLLADEPTTALDVTTQAEILRLLGELQRGHDTAVVLVTHDIRIAEDHADRVAVMYAGRVVEDGPVSAVINRPLMPYTRALMTAVPQPESPPHSELPVIEGRPPDLRSLPVGCAFAPRCRFATDVCRSADPPVDGAADHRYRCWHPLTDGGSDDRA